MKIHKIKDLKPIKKDESKYRMAKLMLKVLEEQPGFLHGFMSVNEYDNKKMIKEKFKKIIKDYEDSKHYICPKCNGMGKHTISSGHGAFGEPEWESYTCDYCRGSGKVTKKHVKKMNKKSKKGC